MSREDVLLPTKVCLLIRKSPACHVLSGSLPHMEGSRYRETNTCHFCCRIEPFNRFHLRFAVCQSPNGNCLNLFRGQNRKWRDSQSERFDRRAQNSSIRNTGARYPSTQWPLGGRQN